MNNSYISTIYFSIDDISAGDVAMFLIVLFAVALIFFIVAVVAVQSRERANKSLPMYRARAVIVDIQRLPPNIIITDATLIWILVEFENGQRMQLNVRPQSGLVIGDTGFLTWQGNRVRNFERDVRFGNNYEVH